MLPVHTAAYPHFWQPACSWVLALRQHFSWVNWLQWKSQQRQSGLSFFAIISIASGKRVTELLSSSSSTETRFQVRWANRVQPSCILGSAFVHRHLNSPCSSPRHLKTHCCTSSDGLHTPGWFALPRMSCTPSDGLHTLGWGYHSVGTTRRQRWVHLELPRRREKEKLCRHNRAKVGALTRRGKAFLLWLRWFQLLVTTSQQSSPAWCYWCNLSDSYFGTNPVSLEQRCPSVHRSAWVQRRCMSSVFHLSLSISLFCLCVPTAFTVSCIQLPRKAFASLSNLKSHNIKRLLRHKTNPRRFQLKVLGKSRGAIPGG